MARQHSIVTQGLILQRRSTGEADRIVTLLTPDLGKVVCIAKGVRKMTSSKRGVLEPGHQVKIMLLPTASWSILTQATLIFDLQNSWGNLPQLRRISQVLEILDRLTLEGEADPQLYLQAIALTQSIIKAEASDSSIRAELDAIIQNLGYPSITDTSHQNMSEYVSELCERKLHSFEFLKVGY